MGGIYSDDDDDDDDQSLIKRGSCMMQVNQDSSKKNEDLEALFADFELSKSIIMVKDLQKRGKKREEEWGLIKLGLKTIEGVPNIKRGGKKMMG